MLCQACHRPTRLRLLCDRCRRGLRPALDGLIGPGVLLVAAFAHTGPARTLVHHLKYRGLTQYAHLVAEVLAPRLPRAPLVPIPRTWSRQIRYGVDPAGIIARSLARRLGTPVVDSFSRLLHAPRRAGGDHSRAVAFPKVKISADEPIILVDDVVTTGRTLATAIEALGAGSVRCAAVANAVPEVPSLLRPNAPKTH